MLCRSCVASILMLPCQCLHDRLFYLKSLFEMKKLLRLFLLLSFCWISFLSKSSAQTEAVIIGPNELCVGECANYEVVLLDTIDFIVELTWYQANGNPISSENPFSLCMDSPNGMSISAVGSTELNQEFETSLFIEATTSVNPKIVSTSISCPADTAFACERVCAFNVATYEVSGVPAGTSVEWEVTGAENFTPNGPSLEVEWGAAGQGEITVTVGGSGTSPAPLQIYCGQSERYFSPLDDILGSGFLEIHGGLPIYDIVITGPNGYVSMNTTTDQFAEYSNLFPGTYTVEVVSSDGQSMDCSFTILDNLDECWISTFPDVIEQPVSCDSCSGLIVLTSFTPTQQFSYIWSDGSTSSGAGGLCPGSYSVTAVDADGCENEISINIVCPTNSCSGADRLCVEILEQPKSNIASTPAAVNGTIEVCQGQTVFFENNSEGATTYIWDFGDLNTSTQFEPEHIYGVPGIYSVSLIARNDCFCSDTSFVEVNVQANEVPSINCTGTICEGESVTYTTDANCSNFTWGLQGSGNIIDGGGTSDNFITVEWTAGPEGEISLGVSGCAGSICNVTNIVPIPIISAAAQIMGSTKVCEGSTEEYFIPNYQGTEIFWSVNGSGNIVDGQGSERVTINWFGAANQNNPQQVLVEFDNCYLGCSGSAALDVDIVPSFYVKGPVEVCENSTEEYRTFNTITNLPVNSNWEVFDENNLSVWTSTGAANAANITWNFPPGSYTVRAQAANSTGFCNDKFDVFIKLKAAPAPVNSIDGEANICPGEAYTYTANGLPLHDFTWSVIGGTPSTFSGDAVNVTWGAAPPYEISVVQTATLGLACTSPPISLTINEIPPILLTGDAQVCHETMGTYSAPFYEVIDYEWEVVPASAGTVVSGQGTASVDVLWHEEGAASVQLSVCSANVGFNVNVLPLPLPFVPDGEVCFGETTTVSTTAAFASYSWKNENGAEISTLPSPGLGGGFYEVEVTDANGCVGDTIFEIIEHAAPQISVSAPIYLGICPGGTGVTLHATTNSGGLDFQWFDGATPVGTNSSTYFTNAASTYRVVATNQFGCTAEAAMTVFDCESVGGNCQGGVCTGPPPDGICIPAGTISFDIAPTTDCAVHDYVNTSTNFIPGSFFWAFGDPASGAANSSSLANPSHTFGQPGFYAIFLSGAVTNAADPNTACLLWQLSQDTILALADFESATVCAGAAMEFFDRTEHMAFASLTSWNWDFGDPASGAANTSADQDPAHVYSTPGNYMVTLTVGVQGGCSTSITKEVTVVAPPTIDFPLPALTCENTPLPFAANTSSDVASIIWDFGDPASGAANSSDQTNTFHEYAAPGIYTISVTAVSVFGCTETYTDNVMVTPNSLGGNIAFSQPSPICEGDNVTLTAPAGGTVYEWSNAGTTDQITVSETGIFGVTLTDAEGCVYSPDEALVDVFGEPNGIIKAVEYNEFNQPVAFFENNYTVCEGEDVSLLIQGSLNYSYQWSTGATGTQLQFTEDRGTLLAVGTYNYTAVVTDNTTGCTSEEGPFTVTVNPKPDVQIASSPSGFLCENNSASLNVVGADPAFSYAWNTGETGTGITVIAGGTYFAQAVNQFGCKNRSNEIVVNNAPDIDIIPTGCHTRCAPDTMCIPDLPLVSSYQWYFNNTPMASPNGNLADPIFDQSGEYYVEMTDVFGCQSTSDVLTLDLFPGFGDILGNVYFDVNENGIIDAPDTLVSGIDIILNDGTVALDTVGSGLSGYVFSGILSTNYILALDTANLPNDWRAYLSFTNIDLVGCDVEEQFDWLLTNQCVANTYNIDSTDCGGGGITFNGTFIPAGSSETFVFTSAGGCDSTIVVNVPNATEDIISVDLQVCPGETIEFNGHEFAAGEQMVFMDVNQFGCDSITTVSVAQFEETTFDLATAQICWNGADGQIEVQNVQGGTAPFLVSLDGQNFQPLLVFDQLPAGQHTVFLQNGDGCQFEETVEIPAISQMVVETSDETMDCGDVVELAPIVISQLPVQWQWADGSSGEQLSVTAPGTYNFTVSNDCEKVERSIAVDLREIGLGTLIYMPNSFSPNGDGRNDCYQGYTAPDLDIQFFVLKIFNRWGGLMFETNDPNACWDGRFKDKQLNPAVFAWYIEMRILNCDGNVVNLFEEGDIHLLR